MNNGQDMNGDESKNSKPKQIVRITLRKWGSSEGNGSYFQSFQFN